MYSGKSGYNMLKFYNIIHLPGGSAVINRGMLIKVKSGE
jgi:hypothetical protein